MNIKLHIGMNGKYKFEALKVDDNGAEIGGSRRELTGWMDNLITDSGLNAFATVNCPLALLVQARVGAGSTTPTNADTNLVAQLATTTTVQATTNGVSGASPHYGYVRRTFRFGIGTAAGNISEVGIFGSTGNTVCISRALITDEFGDPTTITVLSDEVLDVIYELRSYAPEADVAYGPINISGVDYSGTIRAANVTNPNGNWSEPQGAGMWGSLGTYASALGNMIYAHASFISPAFATQTLGAITATVTGTPYYALTITPEAYVADSFYRNHEIFYDLNNGNVPGGIGSTHILTSFGAFQMSFSPKIDKTVAKRLRLNVRVSWGRYTP